MGIPRQQPNPSFSQVLASITYLLLLIPPAISPQLHGCYLQQLQLSARSFFPIELLLNARYLPLFFRLLKLITFAPSLLPCPTHLIYRNKVELDACNSHFGAEAMEGGGSEDASLLLNLLSESIEQIAQLESAVDAPHRAMTQRVQSNIKKALSIAKMYSEGSQQMSFTINGALDSLNSASPRSHNSEKVSNEQEHRALCKKRKTMDKCTRRVQVLLRGGDGAMDDGYSWRKYGQKDILGAIHPRGYYRCTHRSTLGCFATKQVQRSDENSNLFDITYKGEHTCMQTSKADRASPFNEPAMQQQQLLKNSFEDKGSMHQFQQDNQILLSLQTSLMAENPKAENEGHSSSFSFPSTAANNTCFRLDEHTFSLSSIPESNLISSFPTPFISPATSESNFYPVSPSMSSYGGPPVLHTSESELNDIVSGTTSMTNSPMAGSSFMLDFGEFDPSFDSNFFH